MESSEFVNRAREHRSSGAVLKIKVSNIRSRTRTAIIAVVEGPTDVGPYEVWIGRILHELTIEFIPGAGKSQLLDFRRRMKDDRTGSIIGTYLFVDRDFDGLRGQEEGEDIFCTEAYSIENYLVSPIILRSILTDEFRCTAETDHRDNILKLFCAVLSEFNDCIRDANLRIYRTRRLRIVGRGIEERISSYVDVSVHDVKKVCDDVEAQKLIRFDREPTMEEIESLQDNFESLDPLVHYRGKFLLAFFKLWLRRLAAERKHPEQSLFPENASRSFSVGNVNLRSLASRASLPHGLEHFVQSMKFT